MKSLELWALPGGFIRKDESVDDAATRVLFERTGLDKIFLKQFYFFGRIERSTIELAEVLVKNKVIDKATGEFLSQRFFTVGYCALVDYSKVTPSIDQFSDDCQWLGLDEIPKLVVDHDDIIKRALVHLRMNLNYQPIGKNLLPKKFTMPELQALYETILGKSLDRRNFQRKMLSYGILTRLTERRQGGAHKAPFLYSFNSKQYERALKEGLNTGW